MKDIIIRSGYMKFQYYLSWILFVLFGFLIAWLIALGLYTYGKQTIDHTKKKKGVLNLTYQKFIFVYGFVVTCLILLIWVGSLVGLL